MTFTPQVLTKTDTNNSTTLIYNSSTSGSSPVYSGSSTETTGFNTLILTLQSSESSTAGGIQIQFSDDNITWLTPYTDTYFSSSVFTKNYLIIKKYYKISYTTSASSTTYITSRLSTDLDSSITQNTSITVFDNNIENTMDAFGKLRVSNPQTLLDIRFPGQSTGDSDFLSNNLQICSSAAASAGATPSGLYENSKLIMTMPFTGASSKYYISQSRNYCIYQPGKSLLFMASGVFDPSFNPTSPTHDTTTYLNSLTTSGDTVSTRIGYFDNTIASNIPTVRNGAYLEINYKNVGGTKTRTVSVNLKNNSLTSIPQSSWNIDKMDGSGPSGLNLDFTYTQLMMIDLEWLGVGRIRFGFFAYGRIQYCHQITNINFITEPYTNSINLPICYSLSGTSAGTTFNGNLTQICSTVISEGGYTPLGRPFSASNMTTSVDVGQSEVPIIMIRGGSTNYYHQNIIPSSLTAISESTNDFIWYRLRLYLAGDTPSTGTINWTDVDSNYSVVQYATNANLGGSFQASNSIIIDQNYFFGRGVNSFENLNNVFSTQILQITSNINNDSDILVLTCYKINSASVSKVYGLLTWQELY